MTTTATTHPEDKLIRARIGRCPAAVGAALIGTGSIVVDHFGKRRRVFFLWSPESREVFAVSAHCNHPIPGTWGEPDAASASWLIRNNPKFSDLSID